MNSAASWPWWWRLVKNGWLGQDTSIMKLLRNLVSLATDQFIGRGLQCIITALIARLIGDEGYGQWTISLTLVGFFAVISGFGLDMLIIRIVARDQNSDSTYIGDVLSLRLILTLVAISSLFVVLPFMDYSLEVKRLVRHFSVTILSGSIILTCQSVYQTFERMQFILLANTISKLAQIIGLIGLSVLGGDPVDVANLIVSIDVFIAFINVYIVHTRFVRLSLGRQLGSIWSLFQEGFPFFLGSLLGITFHRVDILLLSKMVTVQDVGLYGAAYRFLEMLLLFPALGGTVIYPRLVKFQATDSRRFTNLYAFTLKYVMIVFIVIVAITYHLSDYLVCLQFGSQFRGAVSIVRVLAWGALFQVPNNLLGRIIFANNQEKSYLLLALMAALAGIILNLVLIPRYSIAGAAWATVLSFAFSTALHVLISSKYTRVLPGMVMMAKVVGVGVLCLGVGPGLFGPWSMIPATMLYIAMLIGLRIVRKDELTLFVPRVRQ